MSDLLIQIRLILEKRKQGTLTWLDWVKLAQLVTSVILDNATPVIGMAGDEALETVEDASFTDGESEMLLSAVSDLCEDVEMDGPDGFGAGPMVSLLLKKLLEIVVEQLLK